MLRRTFLTGCSLLATKTNGEITRATSLVHKFPQLVSSSRNFHFSTPRKAINPLFWKILQPVSRVAAAVFGRMFRKWWFSLPPERQRKIYESFMRHRNKLIYAGVGFLGGCSVYYWYHVELTPITHRRRFVSLTQNQFHQLLSFELGVLLKQFESQRIPDRDPRVQRVRRIAKQLLSANSDLEHFRKYDWSIHVIDSPIENCFVLPNGHIFMFTGMLDKTLKNDDYLGIILGHEMAHAVLGHGLEQISRGQVIDIIKIVVGGIIWAVIPFNVGALFTNIFSDSAMKIALELPYSRKLEMEADDVGLLLAAKACFDPRESYAFWLGMKMKDKVEGPGIEIPNFLSTHLSHGDRANRMDPYIEEALKIRAECRCPPLKPYDPRVLADYKKQMIEQELALMGRI